MLSNPPPIRMAVRLTLILLAAIWIAPSPPSHGPIGHARAESTEELINQLDRGVARVTDLEAQFTQEKVSPILDQPLVSTGRVQVTPTLVRWETLGDDPTVMLVSEDQVQIYYPQLGVMEVYDVPAQARRFTLSPLARWSQLKKYFLIEPQPQPAQPPDDPPSSVVLRMVPKLDKLRRFVVEAMVRVDLASALAQKAVVCDPDGGRVVIEFSHIKTNQGLGDDQLRLVVPPSTEIRRPLGDS